MNRRSLIVGVSAPGVAMAANAQDKIAAAYRRNAAEDYEREEERRKWEVEWTEKKRAVAALPMRPAHLAEYVAWLRGYLAIDGNEVTHAYDYKFPIDRFYVATANLVLPELHGALSLALIIPTGIAVTMPNGIGHSDLYYMDGFRVAGGFVPAYSNIAIP